MTMKQSSSEAEALSFRAPCADLELFDTPVPGKYITGSGRALWYRHFWAFFESGSVFLGGCVTPPKQCQQSTVSAVTSQAIPVQKGRTSRNRAAVPLGDLSLSCIRVGTKRIKPKMTQLQQHRGPLTVPRHCHSRHHTRTHTRPWLAPRDVCVVHREHPLQRLTARSPHPPSPATATAPHTSG